MEIKTSKLSNEDISMIDRINDTEHVLTNQYMPEKLRDAFVRGGERTAVITTQKEYSFHELGRDVSSTAWLVAKLSAIRSFGKSYSIGV